jgi:hypothetical protein
MQAESFTDNWAYLKVELNHLERLLLAAVAKQKKENKEADRFLRTPADRASQHWLQGLMNLEGTIGYDSPPPVRPKQTTSYAQQLEQRIQATQQQGKLLALPALCDRLKLSGFEKNLLLLGIAPEIHRRYARLYEYLNGSDRHLLTVDLALRLLCRTDPEWRQARARLQMDAPLVQHQLIEILAQEHRPFLQHSVRLSPALINYLLSEVTAFEDVDRLLHPEHLPVLEEVTPSLKQFAQPDTKEFAPHLVLPNLLRQQLQWLAQELRYGQQVDEDWGLSQWQGQTGTGKLVWLVGSAGTGKTAAVMAIAMTSNLPLQQLDLSQRPDAISLKRLCQQLQRQSVPLLLIKHIDRWFDSPENLDQPLQQLLRLRQQAGQLTLLTSHREIAIPESWQQAIADRYKFTKPTASERSQIWQQVFPPHLLIDASLNQSQVWQALGAYVLTGGEITQIARSASIHAAVDADRYKCQAVLTIDHVAAALQQHHPKFKPLEIKAAAPPARKTANSKTSAAKAKSRSSSSTQNSLK